MLEERVPPYGVVAQGKNVAIFFWVVFRSRIRQAGDLFQALPIFNMWRVVLDAEIYLV